MATTEVTSQGWLSRLGGAFKGILFGLVLIAIAFFLLFWNEGRAVERHKTLKEGAGAVVSVPADRVDPAHEGDLVHLTGRAETDEVLSDETFGVEARALRLEREVEMYQWKEDRSSETKKKVGGGTETTTTYTYEKTWSERPIDSSGFKETAGHQNPGSMPWQSAEQTAGRVTLGEYRLPTSLVRRIDRWEELPIGSASALPWEIQRRAELHGSGLYFSESGDGSPSSPEIGDVRVSFRVVKPTEISVVAQQTGQTLQPFQAEAGGTIELLQVGTVAAAQMFEAAERQNTMLTWALRLGGLLMMAFGFGMVLRPLSVLADVLPPVGSLVGVGIGLVSFLLAAFFSLVTIAVAWVFYRPLLGVTLLVVAVAVVVYLVVKARKAEPVTPETATPPPPPPPPA
jgi:hypothetical protein